MDQFHLYSVFYEVSTKLPSNILVACTLSKIKFSLSLHSCTFNKFHCRSRTFKNCSTNLHGLPQKTFWYWNLWEKRKNIFM